MTSILIRNPDLLFVHIPKNGGTSVESWFLENQAVLLYRGVRVSFRKYHESLDVLRTYQTTGLSFAIVRNPWDRVVSGYHYLLQKKKERRYSRLFCQVNGIDSVPEFSEFVLNLDQWKVPESRRSDKISLVDQWKWIPNGVDILLRQESLSKDFEQIQSILNVFAPLPVSNTTAHSSYRTYYNDQTKDVVARRFKQDIERFGYLF